MNVFWHVFDVAWDLLFRWMRTGWTIFYSTEFISALGGAFFGVAGASWLESGRRRREKRDREYEAILRTQAVIISQGNSLGWIAKDYPSHDSFDNLKTVVLGLTRQMLDFRDLAFVAKSSDPQLLIELDVANESYDFFRRLLEFRNAAIEEFLRHSATEIKKFDATTGHIEAEGLLHKGNFRGDKFFTCARINLHSGTPEELGSGYPAFSEERLRTRNLSSVS